MPVIARYTLAIVAGTLAAAILVATIEVIGHRQHPPPPGLDPADRDAFRAHVETLPTSAFVIVLLAWTIGAGVGGWIAATVAGSRPMLFAGIIGGMVMAGAIANLVLLPHPAWMAIVAVVAIPGASIAAARLAPQRRGDPRGSARAR